MALVTQDEGNTLMLNWLLGTSGDATVLRLYSNNYTPVHTSTLASFTECTFAGYAAVTLARASWNAAILISDTAQVSYGTVPVAWTAGNTQAVYGYFVQDQGSSHCVWAEQFGTSRTLNNGDVLQLTPTFQLSSAN